MKHPLTKGPVNVWSSAQSRRCAPPISSDTRGGFAATSAIAYGAVRGSIDPRLGVGAGEEVDGPAAAAIQQEHDRAQIPAKASTDTEAEAARATAEERLWCVGLVRFLEISRSPLRGG